MPSAVRVYRMGCFKSVAWRLRHVVEGLHCTRRRRATLRDNLPEPLSPGRRRPYSTPVDEFDLPGWPPLRAQVRHFNADFTAWENKDEFVDFRLVAFDEDELHFGGLSFYRDGDDAINGYTVTKNGGAVSEHHLRYKRRRHRE